jgi:hypothetical protein
MFFKSTHMKEEENASTAWNGQPEEKGWPLFWTLFCFEFSVKPWTSHFISWGLKIRGSTRWYLKFLLVWMSSGSNLNVSWFQKLKGHWAILSMHTGTHHSTLCRHKAQPGFPLFLSVHLSLILGLPSAQEPASSCRPETLAPPRDRQVIEDQWLLEIIAYAPS